MRGKISNRGSILEEEVLYACSQYHRKGIARIDKVPTPIGVVKVTKDGRLYGYYDQKSTVDFIGGIQGKMVCFDCKETTNKTSFPLKNVHDHQVKYMEEMAGYGHVAFLIVKFVQLNRYFRLSYQELEPYWRSYKQTSEKGKRRPQGSASIPLEAFTCEIFSEKGLALHFLKGLVY